MYRCVLFFSLVTRLYIVSGYGTGESSSVNRDFFYDPSLRSITYVWIVFVFLFFSLFVRIGTPRIRSCFSFSSKFLLWGVVSRSDVIGVISLQLRSFLEALLVVQT